MESKNLIGIVIGAAIAIIIIASVAAPTLSNASDATKTAHNTGLIFQEADDEDHVLHFANVDGALKITMDDTHELETIPASYSAVIGENSLVRVQGLSVSFWGVNSSSGASVNRSVNMASSPTDYVDVKISGGNGEFYTNGNLTTTFSTVLAFESFEGEYRMVTNGEMFVTDSTVIGGGVTYSPFSTGTEISFWGQYDELTVNVGRPDTTTFVSYEYNTSPVCTNLKTLDSLVFTLDENGTEKQATYTYFLAPADVIYDNPGYVGDGSAAIIKAIPVVLILAVLLGVVGVAVRGSRD